MEDDSTAPAIRSVSRALAVLAVCAESEQPVRLRDIVGATKLPKSTVLRILNTLEAEGLIWTTDDGRSALGFRLLQWIDATRRAWHLPADIVHVMRSLADLSGETVNLYLRSGSSRICIAQEQGPQLLRHVVPVGGVLPIWCGAASKILLSDSDPDSIGDIAERSEGQVSADVLRRSVRTAMERGVCVSHGEREVGASSIAAPIRSRTHSIVAALALSGPTSRFSTAFVDAYKDRVVAAAEKISRLDFHKRVSQYKSNDA